MEYNYAHGESAVNERIGMRIGQIRLRSVEVCSYSIMAALILLLATAQIQLWSAGFGTQSSLTYYIYRMVSPFRTVFLYLILFYLSVASVRFMLFVINSARRNESPRAYLSAQNVRKKLAGVAADVRSAGRVIFPGAVSFVALSETVTAINVLNANRLVDSTFLAWDKVLTGSYPFIAWPSLPIPDWFLAVTVFSFAWLPVVLVLLAFYLVARRGELAYEFIAALSIAMLVNLPLWHAMPAQSPHDRYLDNVYDLEIPDELSGSMESFSPAPRIAAFLDETRELKSAKLAGNDYPTSTFPSAHAAWGVLVAVFMFRADKRLFAPAFLLALFSTIGTFLLVQHYFVDTLAGIAVGAFAAYATYRLASRDKLVIGTEVSSG